MPQTAARAVREEHPQEARIARPALEGRLAAALQRGSLLVIADAGYGKTMALQGALTQAKLTAAWVRCTESDDAGALMDHVMGALRRALPGAIDVFEERLLMPGGRIEAEALTAQVAAHLEAVLVEPLAVRGVPCLPTPIVFDPGLPPGPGGLRDEFPTVAPTCPGDVPVGKLELRHRKVTTRAGRPARVELTWRTPRRWRDLHEISIQFAGPNGRPLATLRFDEDSGKVGLSRGSRRSGRRIRADRRGTLRVGGVRIRLGRDAVRGSGPRGRLVRMRFGVSTRRTLTLSVGAADDAGVRQPARPAGAVVVGH